MDELASLLLLLCLSATLFDRDRAFVDSDFGVFHDSSGAAIDAMGRPIGREMKGGSEEEDTRQPNGRGRLLFAREERGLTRWLPRLRPLNAVRCRERFSAA